MPIYDVPGVYIEEQTGPGVIAGVGTSTAAFIGAALRGPLKEARRVSSFDEFIELYGETRENRPWPYLFIEGRPYFMAFAVEGFFTNGGRQAYILRVGTADQAKRPILNQASEEVFVVRALQDGALGNDIQVETQLYSRQTVATGKANISQGAGTSIITVDSPQQFRVGDWATRDGSDRKRITEIRGNDLILEAALGGAGNTLRIDNLPATRNRVRLDHTAGLYPDGMALLSGDDATAAGTNIVTERVVVQSVDPDTHTVTLAAAGPTITIGAQPTSITLSTPGPFKVGDVVTSNGQNRARINQISQQGILLTLDQALAGATNNERLRIAGTPPPRATTYNLNADTATPPSLTLIRVVAHGQASITSSTATTNPQGNMVTTLTVNYPMLFRPGDIVTSNGTDRARIERIQGNIVTLDQILPGIGGSLRIANINPAQRTFRVTNATELYPGSLVLLQGSNPAGNAVENYVVIQAVDGAGLVTLEAQPAITATYNLNVDDGLEPILIPQEFRLIITPPPPPSGTIPPERFENLSLNHFHPRYIFNTGVITSTLVAITPPAVPPTTSTYRGKLVSIIAPAKLAGGLNDQPSGLTSANYQDTLNLLRTVDDINMVCIPDAAAHPERQAIQIAQINHCLDMRDRVAILDSVQGAPASGPGSIEETRGQVQATNGFAALYYPWLTIRDPTSQRLQARTLTIPPSGHIAGIYARSDTERGVHKAPANTEVRGVLSLERVLSDGQQGPLNLKGINVLRIFPGSGQVTVWGARTTVDPNITDWVYINVRRLMLYIEESIEEGIRWAVFEPNNLQLWQKLKRTINEFLTRVWRDGALFGKTAEDAFYVRIDEALNPPSTQALGRLYIEIGVRPAYPAEFIIVRIGLWQGKSEVSER